MNNLGWNPRNNEKRVATLKELNLTSESSTPSELRHISSLSADCSCGYTYSISSRLQRNKNMN
jgi:hypothetical protein